MNGLLRCGWTNNRVGWMSPHDPPHNPFADLTAAQIRALLLRLRLYAEWKVRGGASRAVELDAENLSLKAIEQTLDGTRRWNSERFDLLKHLSNCIDSYVSHHFEALSRRPRALDAEEELARLPAAVHTPEEAVTLDRDVADLRGYIQREHPHLRPLLDLVVEQELSLSDRADAARGMGLDPEDSAQMQRAYRAINALKKAVLRWRDAGENGP